MRRNRRVLTTAKPADTHKIHYYKTPAKRPYHLNTKFADKVAQSMGHTYRYTYVTNKGVDTPVSKCTWTAVGLGFPPDISGLMTQVRQNLAGRGEADPNTVDSSTDQFKLRYKLLKMQRRIHAISTCTDTMHIEMYELIPRRDLYASVQYPSPDPITLFNSFKQQGNIDIGSSTWMGSDDPRWTPFMSPILCQHWKILNVRKFQVAPGAQFNAYLAVNNKDLVQGLDDNAVTEVYARKKTARVLLIKCYGQLGVATDEGGNKFLRNLQCSYAFKQDDLWEVHAAHESRKLIVDGNLNAMTGGTYVSEAFIKEESATLSAVDRALTTSNS